MSFRKNINFTNFVIGLCIFFSAILLIITVPILINWICNPDSVTEVPSNIASTSTTLIVVLISTITLLITKRQTDESLNQTKETIDDNKKFNTDSLEKTETMIKDNKTYNEKSISQTKELLEQNEKLSFIQLRFNDAKYGINNLMLFLQITLNISNQLRELHNSSKSEKDHYLTERGFLIMQFVNLTSNFDLLNKLPITLRKKIEYEFDDKLTNNQFIDDYILQYNLIIENKYPKKVIRNYIEYNNYIHEFKNNKHPEQNEFMFRTYYGSKNISTQSFYNHFYNILHELTDNSIEKLILKDKNKSKTSEN